MELLKHTTRELSDDGIAYGDVKEKCSDFIFLLLDIDQISGPFSL